MDNYDYLEPSFNPKTLRIAELRKILIFHEIDFVTGAKKGDLVEAFQRGIVPQRAKLLLEVTNATSPSATRSSNPIQNASLASSTRRRSRLNDESPPARKTRQQQQLDSAIFDDESKPAKISPNRRRHRSLAKPFVDPGNIEDNATPVSEEKVTPVKTITPRPNRRRSSSFSKSAHKELNLDHLSSSAEKKLDSDAKTTSSEAERRERIDKSPFSNVNFFQSASPDPKPVIKKEKRKRQHDDEPYSARKKRELEESIKQESFATPTKASHRQANATSSTSKTDYNKEHDTTLHTAAEGRTPKRSSEFKQPPHTDPGKGSARSTGFVDATYSVGKKQPGLFHPGAGRKLSFMPDVDQLNVSKEFSKQLINSSPIKHEKKLDTAKNEKIDISEEEDIEIPSDDDEVDLSEEKEDSSELSSSEQGDDEDDVDQSETTPDKFPLTQIVGVLLFFILGTALARWWIIERINAGYCDVGFVNWKPHYSHFTPTKISDYFDPEYFRDRGSQVLDYIRPGCQNCPAHAQCYRGFKAVCDPGFVKKQSILGHFLPIRPTCEPDTQKQRRVKAIANKALEILGQRNVDFQCGKYKGENGLDARELHDAIHKLTSTTLDKDEFQDLWTSAVADIENHDDITVRQISTNVAPPTVTSPAEQVTKHYISKSLTNIPWGCAVKLSILRRLDQHKYKLTLVGLVLIAIVTLRNYLRAREAERRCVTECATAVFARLKEQKRLAETDTNGLTVKFVPVPYLLSELLAGQQPHTAKYNRVRSAVERVVESNPLVRAKQHNVEGEIMRVWEWVGV